MVPLIKGDSWNQEGASNTLELADFFDSWTGGIKRKDVTLIWI